jgi:hypothetical protein
MSLVSYGQTGSYSVGRPRTFGQGVYQLLRPKQLSEVNHFRHTPYTERICDTCRRTLYHHFYLVFLDPIKCSRLYCERDGTSYFTKEKYKI